MFFQRTDLVASVFFKETIPDKIVILFFWIESNDS